MLAEGRAGAGWWWALTLCRARVEGWALRHRTKQAFGREREPAARVLRGAGGGGGTPRTMARCGTRASWCERARVAAAAAAL